MTVAFVDVLDDLFAALVLEIHIDIGRLLALLRNEALEQEIDRGGIDIGDPKHETDGGIGRRTAALAEDAARLGETDNVAHGEEIGRVIERGDQRELLLQRLAHFLRNPFRVPRGGAFPGELFQMELRRLALGHRLVGIIVFQLIERKVDALREAYGLVDRFGGFAKQPRHFFRRF